jgi:hypothetical protein
VTDWFALPRNVVELRDVKVTRICEGTDQNQRLVIAWALASMREPSASGVI